MSRLPVREALQILGNEGLVNVRPNKVAVINNISGKFLKDHFAFRSFLEQEAARAACRQRMDCGPLWDNYRLAEAAIDRRDYSGFDEYNRAIHAILWHAPDNSQMERVLSQLWNTLSPTRPTPSATPGSPTPTTPRSSAPSRPGTGRRPPAGGPPRAPQLQPDPAVSLR